MTVVTTEPTAAGPLPGVPHDLYPFASHWLQRGPHRMHYLDEGQGPPVVMVHGNPSWSLYWRHLVLALRTDHRCIVPDHIGCGLSDKPSDEAYAYTLAQRIDDLDALIQHTVPTGPLTLAVHDWGGMIGLGWAARNPGRVVRLVVLNTAAFPLPATKPLPWQLKLTRTPIGTVLVRGFNAFSRGTATIGCTRNPMPERVKLAYQAPYNSWANRIATLRFVQDIPLVPGHPGFDIVSATRDALPTLLGRIPVLVEWGDQDIVFDDHFLAEWKRLVPNATVHVHEGCGHYVLEDVPTEVCANVRAFFSEHAVPTNPVVAG